VEKHLLIRVGVCVPPTARYQLVYHGAAGSEGLVGLARFAYTRCCGSRLW
jgi:hypothetical protein